ncbi:MAG: 4-hydroxy-tetrahydrodipicolinate synthase [Polyangiaceae bacterium]|nr:4-hydroxy-tetrahydrodipicolinate synthase [Polyangiaceae bacterium]
MAAVSLSGAFTAVVTPFSDDLSEIDWPAFERLVDAQLAGGISGLVPCGTTGESPTLTDSEQRELVKRTAALAKGKVPIFAGTGSNSTKKTIEASKAALEAGADGVMIVMPYYNKPSQDGLIRHIQTVAKELGGAPVILYNIPGRTGIELTVESTLKVLDSSPNVVGIKDATGNVMWCQELLRRAASRVTLLSGDDPLTLPMMVVGAKGVISVTSNLLPREVSEVCADALAGRWDEAKKKHLALLPVHRAMFVEPNPQPVKAALALEGRMKPGVRLPLVEASGGCREAVSRAVEEYRKR